jgi:hypothetical protein
MTLESDAAKLRKEYDEYYGDFAYENMSINYVRFMREHVLVERAKRDHIASGLCYGYLRVPSPMVVQKKRAKGDRHGIKK